MEQYWSGKASATLYCAIWVLVVAFVTAASWGIYASIRRGHEIERALMIIEESRTLKEVIGAIDVLDAGDREEQIDRLANECSENPDRRAELAGFIRHEEGKESEMIISVYVALAIPNEDAQLESAMMLISDSAKSEAVRKLAELYSTKNKRLK